MSVAPSSAIRTRSLVLAHGAHLAVDGADLDLPTGSVIAVIGPNGSGKSSFLDAVAGLLAPRSGSISVLGEPPGRRHVAYVFQSTETPAHLPLTVAEVVLSIRLTDTEPPTEMSPAALAPTANERM